METPFYKKGLRFECKRCSACCRFEPGYVFLSNKDISRLLKALKCTREYFIETYCRIIDINGIKRISLKEKSNYDCIFWEDGGCIVYKQRPLQCRSYPFWSPHLASLEDWNKLSKSCPGINCGDLYSRQEIEWWLAIRMKEPIINLS